MRIKGGKKVNNTGYNPRLWHSCFMSFNFAVVILFKSISFSSYLETAGRPEQPESRNDQSDQKVTTKAYFYSNVVIFLILFALNCCCQHDILR
jgi:hypothetical protein